MKKLTFKVSTKKEGNIVALIKAIDKINCRIQLDIENGFVTVENVNDTMIDTVIELINNNYILLGVDIDNNVDSDVNVPAVEETTAVSTKSESASLQKPTINNIEPQSEDDLIIKKVEFENKYVEQLINKLLRTVYWAMFTMKVSEKDIERYIYTSISEISMRYNNKPIVPCSIGDVVDCNYGEHIPGEINGGHVGAIVCNITNEKMVYLIPITKVTENIVSRSYLTVNVPDDITYSEKRYTGGTALLDKSKYVRSERINEVIGKTSPEFFAKVLYKLATTFDFTGTNLIEEQQDTEKAITEKTSFEEVYKNTETKPKGKNTSNAQNALLDAIGFALDKLDSSKKPEEQVDSFLTDIGMPINEEMVRQSFVIACDIKKITYENVILELHNMNPKVKENIIMVTLKENFKKWLEQYPELAKKCPKISFMSVLKIFAKRLL